MSAVTIPAVKSFHGTATSTMVAHSISVNYTRENIFSVGCPAYEVVITNKDTTASNALRVAFDDPNGIQGNYQYVLGSQQLVVHPPLKNTIYVMADAGTPAYSITVYLKNSFNQ